MDSGNVANERIKSVLVQNLAKITFSGQVFIRKLQKIPDKKFSHFCDTDSATHFWVPGDTDGTPVRPEAYLVWKAIFIGR